LLQAAAEGGVQLAFKLLIILMLVAIVASLGSALWHLSRGSGDSRRMFRSLALRVGLSVALFIVLMVAWMLGLIKPHGL
jgi:cytochrome bd-type quinol oxidase subunit 2